MPIVMNKVTGRPEYIEDDAGGTPGAYVGAGMTVRGSLPAQLEDPDFAALREKFNTNGLNPRDREERDFHDDIMRAVDKNRYASQGAGGNLDPRDKGDRDLKRKFDAQDAPSFDLIKQSLGQKGVSGPVKRPAPAPRSFPLVDQFDRQQMRGFQRSNTPAQLGEDGLPMPPVSTKWNEEEGMSMDFDQGGEPVPKIPQRIDLGYPADKKVTIYENDLPPMEKAPVGAPSMPFGDDRQLMALFAKSAAQAGSIGGKMADAQPVQDYANSLDKSDMDLRDFEAKQAQQGFQNKIAQQNADSTAKWKNSLSDSREQSNAPMGPEAAKFIIQEIEKIDPGASQRILESGWDLSRISMKTLTTNPAIKKIFSSSQKYAMWLNALGEPNLLDMQSGEIKPGNFQAPAAPVKPAVAGKPAAPVIVDKPGVVEHPAQEPYFPPADVGKMAADERAKVSAKILSEYKNQPLLAKVMQKIVEDAVDKEFQAAQGEKSREAIVARAEKAGKNAAIKVEKSQDKEFDRKVEKYIDRIEKTKAIPALQQVDALLEKLEKYGKNIPGYGRVKTSISSILLPEQDREIRQDVDAIFNQKLYDTSGATVTADEMKRAQKGFGNGVGLPPSALIQGLKSYRNYLNSKLDLWSAGFSPGVRMQAMENFQIKTDIPGVKTKVEEAPAAAAEIKVPASKRLEDAIRRRQGGQ